ncbi:MAG: hypothetical protein HY701_06720 [Gemmatimonadetes bacterium]|nr:hypothetical protein [Gemmatimonadota bacterium]
MTAREPDNLEEIARRGDAIYETMRARLEAESFGKIVAIDVESADYAVAGTVLAAAHALQARRPNAEIWVVRIGYKAVYRFGFAPLPLRA